MNFDSDVTETTLGATLGVCLEYEWIDFLIKITNARLVPLI